MDTFWHRLPRPIKILAPMEDVTDTVFRRIVARCGRPDVFFTEFTCADGLFSRGAEHVIHRLQFTEEERPLVAQIWGNIPENYLKAAKLIREMGFDGLDINMGCPVSKIIKDGACSGLIENPELAKELVLAAKEGAGSMPVSVKTRIGFKKVATEEWIGFLLELEPAALTVHGRTAKQLSKVPASWEEIQKAVALRDSMGKKTIIIGNGDVKSISEIEEKSARFGVDGVMVGRGIFEDLFLFAGESSQPVLRSRDPREKLKLLKQHLELFESCWKGGRGFGIMKKFFKIYIASFHDASDLRVRLMACDSMAEAHSILDSWNANDVPGSEIRAA